MSKLKRAFGALLGLLLLDLLSASADDGEAEIAAGGIEFKKSEAISMTFEDLFISEKVVRVKFEFKNNSSKDYKTTVAFPLPTYAPYYLEDGDCPGMGTGCSDARGIEGAGNSFTVHSDGVTVKPELEVKAMIGDRDITSVLRKYSIPMELEKDAQEAIAKLPPVARKDLATLGLSLLSKPDENGWARPAWVVKRTYHWEQTFRAGKPTMLEHSYRPIAGRTQDPDSEDFKTAYCIDGPAQKALKLKREAHLKKDPGRAPLAGTTVHYILTSANTWIGPIRKFILTVEKPDENAIASWCMRGIKKVGPKIFRTELKDFKPVRELKILFVH